MRLDPRGANALRNLVTLDSERMLGIVPRHVAGNVVVVCVELNSLTRRIPRSRIPIALAGPTTAVPVARRVDIARCCCPTPVLLADHVVSFLVCLSSLVLVPMTDVLLDASAPLSACTPPPGRVPRGPIAEVGRLSLDYADHLTILRPVEAGYR